MNDTKFGWLSPAASHAGSDFKPITIFQAEHLFPSVLPFFDSVWVADHFYGFDDAKKEGFLEAWTTLTWLAAKFDNVGVAHHVVGHGYRNPALIAKMASTLQVLTKGRFILGIGAGWREEEYRAYGYEFPPAAVRIRQLEEVVQICRTMWTEEHPRFQGKYFSIDDAVATPRPEVMPQVCIGSSGESIGLKVVGRRADIWNTGFQEEESWKRKRDIVHEAATAFGRDSADVTCCVTVTGSLPESAPDSEKWLQRLVGLRDLGISYFVLDFGHPLDAESALRFAEEVMAPMRQNR
jgi:alkanesulfonate monooxygenase SsuD/methylene tetrahydromethanopterin reductase-like flavin-dependent oxidoreductase (luciferase family)